MGILNITPDSFFSGSRFRSAQGAAFKAAEMAAQGAKIIDVGAYSSRPGADAVGAQEEWARLEEIIPAVKEALSGYPEVLISVDTFRGDVAQKAVSAGAHLVNDISGGNLDPQMYDAVAELDVPYILMHMQGDPATMQMNPTYEHVTRDIVRFFSERLPMLHEKGIHDTIVDVGFGFGKTLEHNYQLLRELHAFQLLGRPVLSGVSRKSMIYKALEIGPEESLNGTTALHMAALMGGSQILRVHDVKEAVETITLFSQMMPEGVDHLLPEWER